MADDDTTAPASEGDPGTPDAPDASADLGDGGKKALEAERTARKAAEREAKKLARDHEAAMAKLASFEEASKTEQQKLLEAATSEAAQAARAEVMAEANKRLLDAELRAAAKGVLNDPADAGRYLDLEALADSDGNPDPAAIAESIQALATERPYLAAGATPANHGSADQGARPGTPKQLTREDVKRMAAEGRHREIVKARQEGRLADLMSSPN